MLFFSSHRRGHTQALSGGRYLQHPLVPGAVLSTLCFSHLVFLRISLGRQCHFCFTGLPKRGLVTCLRQVANKWHKPISHRILAPKCMLFLVWFCLGAYHIEKWASREGFLMTRDLHHMWEQGQSTSCLLYVLWGCRTCALWEDPVSEDLGGHATRYVTSLS